MRGLNSGRNRCEMHVGRWSAVKCSSQKLMKALSELAYALRNLIASGTGAEASARPSAMEELMSSADVANRTRSRYVARFSMGEGKGRSSSVLTRSRAGWPPLIRNVRCGRSLSLAEGLALGIA